jgi:hypothetical protein
MTVTVTAAGSGTDAGAVYFPVASIVPQLAPEQPVPATLQVTPWSAALVQAAVLVPLAQLRLALNCCVPPT